MEEKEISRCTGHCCREFSLPYSPEELKEKRKQAIKGGHSNTDCDLIRVPKMVIYLGYYPPRQEIYDCDVSGYTEGLHHYTCKYHDPESGNCTIHSRRPDMCSRYPYGQTCTYKGCTRKTEVNKIDVTEEEPKAKENITEIEEKI